METLMVSNNITTIICSLISAILGSGIMAYVNYKNAIKKLKHAESKFFVQLEQDNKNKREKELIADKEYIIEKLYTLRVENSLTMNYIMEDKAFSALDIHDQYLKQNKMLSKMITRATMSYPHSIDDLRELAKLNNFIWGSRQNYFGHSKDKESIKKTSLIEYFDKTASISSKIVNGLE